MNALEIAIQGLNEQKISLQREIIRIRRLSCLDEEFIQDKINIEQESINIIDSKIKILLYH